MRGDELERAIYEKVKTLFEHVQKLLELTDIWARSEFHKAEIEAHVNAY